MTGSYAVIWLTFTLVPGAPFSPILDFLVYVFLIFILAGLPTCCLGIILATSKEPGTYGRNERWISSRRLLRFLSLMLPVTLLIELSIHLPTLTVPSPPFLITGLRFLYGTIILVMPFAIYFFLKGLIRRAGRPLPKPAYAVRIMLAVCLGILLLGFVSFGLSAATGIGVLQDLGAISMSMLLISLVLAAACLPVFAFSARKIVTEAFNEPIPDLPSPHPTEPLQREQSENAVTSEATS